MFDEGSVVKIQLTPRKADVVPLHRAQQPAAGVFLRQWHSIKLKLGGKLYSDFKPKDEGSFQSCLTELQTVSDSGVFPGMYPKCRWRMTHHENSCFTLHS